MIGTARKPSPRRNLRLAFSEGLLFALMVGLGETWFVPWAVRLGASGAEAGLLAGLGLGAGTIGSFLSVLLVQKFQRRKPLVMVGVLVQALVLFAMAQVAKATHPLTAFQALVCVYYAAAQLAGATWSSWFGDLVPSRIRGRFFGCRTRAIHLVTFLSLVSGGTAVHLLSESPGDHRGFELIFVLAGLARMGSLVLLGFCNEPRGQSPPAEPSGYRSPIGGPGARLVLLAGALQTTVYIGSPFFGPFMLEELQFTYLEYTCGAACVVIAKVLSLPRWGLLVDRLGARPVYLLALLLVGLVPLPWLWTAGLAWAAIAQAFSGFSWGAHEISQFSLLLEGSKPGQRQRIFAANNLASSGAQLLGTLIGTALLGPCGLTYASVFAISAGARLLVAVGAVPYTPHPRPGRPRVGHGEILLRVVGLRPQGGLTHRPIPEPNSPVQK